MDLNDLVKGRPVPGRIAYRERVRRLLKSPKAQVVGKNIFCSLPKTCHEIKKRGGKASSKG